MPATRQRNNMAGGDTAAPARASRFLSLARGSKLPLRRGGGGAPLHRLKCAALALLLVALFMTGVDGLSPRRAAAAPPTGTTILELITLNAFNRMVHETGGPDTAHNYRHSGQFASLPALPQRSIKDEDTLTGPFSIWFRTSSDSSLNDGGLVAADFTITNGAIGSITKHAPNIFYDPDIAYWTADITPSASATIVTIQLNGDASSHSFTINSSAPKVRWAGFSSGGGRQNNGRGQVGQNIDLSVQFSEKVTVVGSPTVTVVAKDDGTTRQAVYQSGSGTSELVFRYTVEAGLYGSATGQKFSHHYTSTSIELPAGASIRDGDSNNATLTLPPRVTRTYNWHQLPTSASSSGLPPVRDGAVYEMYVEFSEPVEVTGNPQTLWIFFGTGDPVVARFGRLNYVSGSGTNTLLFRYTLTSATGLNPLRSESGTALWFYGDSAIRSKANGLDVHYKLGNSVVPIFAVTEGQTHYLGQSLECCGAWPPSPADSYVEVQISTQSPHVTITDDTMRWHPQCPSGNSDCVEVPYTTTHYARLDVGTVSEDTWTTVKYDWTRGTDTQFRTWWGVFTRELVVLDSGTPSPGSGTLPPGSGGEVVPVRRAADFELDTGRGIRSLHDDNAAASGVWSDGESLWVLDAAAGRVFVYALADGQRRAGLEFELDAANVSPVGLSSDGETVWVLDSAAGRLFAYSLVDGERLPERDVALEGRFGSPRAVWSGGGSHYVVSNPLAVYDAATGALVGSWELDRLNRSPAGMWSDGVTLWISNSRPSKLFAYRLPLFDGAEQGESGPAGEAGRLVRVRGEEFNLLPVVGNRSPAGLWSDGATMYVADSDDGRVYAYKMPDGIDARLASLSLTGVDIGEFSPAVANYSGVAEAGVRRTIVKARAAQPGARVAIEPADVYSRPGHHARVFNGAEVAVTVISPDGSRSRVYRVQISAPPQGHFTDDDDSVHADDIDAAATAGIVSGCNPPEADRFCPDRPVTRAEMATFLVRALDLALAERSAGFSDVDPQGVHADTIDAVVAASIVSGCNPPEADRFCPDRPVTRAEMATFLVRALDLAPAQRPARFVDVDRQSVHAADIDALYAAGITKGCFARPRRYCGDRPVTRAEMAAFLARALDLPAP